MKTLDQLSQAWQNIEADPKLVEDLSPQQLIKWHPTLKRTRIKLVIESLLLLIFLVFYYTALDGVQKSLTMNFLLVLGVVLYISAHVYTYNTLIKTQHCKTVKQTLERSLQRLKVAKLLNVCAVTIFVIAMLLFSTLNIVMTGLKIWILIGIIGTYLILCVMMIKLWNNKINQISAHIDELS